MKTSRIVIFLPATGFNEAGYAAVTSAMKNAGISVSVVSESTSLLTGDNGKKVKPDILLSNCKAANFNLLLITGGKGVVAYKDHPGLRALVTGFHNSGRLLAGICTGPLLLAPVINSSKAEYTCHDSVKNELKQTAGRFTDKGIAEDGLLLTASGEEYAGPFADRIIRKLLHR